MDVQVGEDPAQLRELARIIHELPWHPIVGVDHELGVHLQLLRTLPGTEPPAGSPHFTVWPTLAQLERACAGGGGRELADAVAHAAGCELRACGVDVTWSPTVDCARQGYYYEPIGRTFHTVASDCIAGLVAGQQRAGVAACAKHFPGMGAASNDSHYQLPVIGLSHKELIETDIAAFEAAIQAGVEVIMTNHAVYPSLCATKQPATVSHGIITGLARERLHFDGVIVTDDLGMAGAVAQFGGDIGAAAAAAVVAGCDLCMISYDVAARYPAAVRAVTSAACHERLSEALRRVDALVSRCRARAAADTVPPLACVGCAEHEELARRAGVGLDDAPLTHSVGTDYRAPTWSSWCSTL
eukprot:TRINITY_DN2568_c0_g1_i2.p1 TRINITY_DN2568_c0_g1~~TRINITY_DN2568_c0_g1_i2.p1  ORF type:complete len:356 (+),score=68.79 TRINITY_DN2568_c0_g1_i2:85-1152(+)